MSRYQNPAFDKDEYRERREEERRRSDMGIPPSARLRRYPVIGVYPSGSTPFVSTKRPSKKAVLKNSKRARKAQEV